MLNLTVDEKSWAFDTLFTNSPIGIAILEPDGTFQSVNAAWCAILDTTQAEWLGKKYQELTTSETIRLDEQNAKLVYEGLIDTYTLPKAYRLKDGTIIKKVKLTVGRIPPSDFGPIRYYVSQIILENDDIVIPKDVAKIGSLPRIKNIFSDEPKFEVPKWVKIVVALLGGIILFVVDHLSKSGK